MPRSELRGEEIEYNYRKIKMKKSYKLLFVCLGNICRSPAAEGMMRRVVEREELADCVEIDSAGTYGGHRGQLPDPRMRSAAANRGLQLTHRARKITEEDFFEFDRIIVMDDMNYENVFRLSPTRETDNKIFRMREFFTRFPEWSYVPDPYYEGHEGFELVLDMLEDGCATLLQEIKPDLQRA